VPVPPQPVLEASGEAGGLERRTSATSRADGDAGELLSETDSEAGDEGVGPSVHSRVAAHRERKDSSARGRWAGRGLR